MFFMFMVVFIGGEFVEMVFEICGELWVWL